MTGTKAAKRSNALLAFDALVDARFVPMDQALDTIEAEQKRDPEVAAGRTIWQWSDIIREAAGVGWASIAKASVPWQHPHEASFETERRLWHNHIEGVVTGPCKVFFGKGAKLGERYGALYQAHWVLTCEKRCLVKDNDRMFRRLSRHVHDVPGYDLTNAFDWYVILVASLRDAGVTLRGYDSLPLSRPIKLPEGVR